MATKPETKLVQKIMLALKRECSGLYFNVNGNPFQRKGISDILGVSEGYFIAIEVKLEGKEDTLTQHQKRFIRDVKKAGGIAFMTTNAEDAVRRVKSGKRKRVQRSNKTSTL